MRHRDFAGKLCSLAVWLAAIALPCAALKFELLEVQGASAKSRIVFIRDCGAGRIPESRPCTDAETQFWEGDSAQLRRILNDSARSGIPVEEAWLFSGGGNLQEGVEIGRVLRENKLTVRIPNVSRVRKFRPWPEPRNEVYCVSACTVAFMGGRFRYMDPGTSYEVHSASAGSDAVPARHLASMKSGNFDQVSQHVQVNATFRAYQLFRHFQNTLIIPLRIAPLGENDERFFQWARNQPSPPYQLAESDRQRFASEGEAAAQDIFMRMERDAMRGAIEQIRRLLPQLGQRATHALSMVEAMYDVSIKETEVMTKETMYKMGYLTQDLDLGSNP